MAKRVARDKYGRFKGKGAIKPFKNNLKGVTRKGHANRGARLTTGRKSSRRRTAILAATAVTVAVAAHAAGKYAAKRSSGSSNGTLRRTINGDMKAAHAAVANIKLAPKVVRTASGAIPMPGASPKGARITRPKTGEGGPGFTKTPASTAKRAVSRDAEFLTPQARTKAEALSRRHGSLNESQLHWLARYDTARQFARRR